MKTIVTDPNENQPLVNVDGTPMVGLLDIHGNPFGVTSTPFSDPIDIGCDIFSSDIFSSDCDFLD